jgi:5-methylcytosine-specific restriction endonuclease McrA
MNLEGRRFKRLDVKKYFGKGRDNTGLYQCRCFCGKLTIASGFDLLHGYRTSCGCIPETKRLKKEADKILHKKIPKSGDSILILYKRYIKGADDRGLEFRLEINEFIKLTSSNCFYCGKKPQQVVNGIIPYIYNGIDRVDNNKGYLIENCVSCCKECNRSKNIMSSTKFLTMVGKIYNNKVAEIND